MINPRLIALSLMVLGTALSRLIPHPWNMTPLAATALFAGAHFQDKRLALAIPLLSMAISDVFLGWHATLPFVYVSFLIIVGIGFWVRAHRSMGSVVAGSFMGSLIFFIITNFGVWLAEGMYPMTPQGLFSCFAAALPFFRNTLVGDLFYTAVLFGGFYIAERAFPPLRESELAPVRVRS